MQTIRRPSAKQDAEWSVIEPLLPKQGKMGRPRKTDLRSVFNAIWYILEIVEKPKDTKGFTV